MENTENTTDTNTTAKTKYCKFCGATIPFDAVICTACGRQVEELKGNGQPQIVINNSNDSNSANTNVNTNVNANGTMVRRRLCNKWVALALCFFFGFFGAHKFYEGKTGMGILYLLTAGLFFIGVIVDFISILMKPNPYAV